MRTTVALLRILLTASILIVLLIVITPSKALADLEIGDWRWLAASVALMPLFLACRVTKWALLEQQVLGPAPWSRILPRYLWGMAVGLITPGRVGELARVRAPKLSARGAGLFFLEKAVEVSCLFSLCLLSLPLSALLPWWTLPPIGFALIVALAGWRRMVIGTLGLIGRLPGGPDPQRRAELASAVLDLRLFGCAALSLMCFLIYVTQAWLMLRAMDLAADPAVAILYPFVLLANLLPITVGGYGLRESLAVVVMRSRDVSEIQAAASVALVTFFNLVIPGLVGVVLRVFGKVPVTSIAPPATPAQENAPVAAEEWDTFWEARKQRLSGRLLAWFRRRFVTTRLAAFIRDNTDKGTLVEAGCGSGEITLLVAAERGDHVVLVDYSAEALRLAGHHARAYGIDAELVQGDIAELSRHVGFDRTNIVFNIGVIEHFKNPAGVLHEMAKVSGRFAIAVIPERSIFWLTFLRVSRLIGLVPADFFVQFFSRDQLASIVTDAGLELRWLRGVRIFGLIPYLGVGYNAGPHSERHGHEHE